VTPVVVVGGVTDLKRSLRATSKANNNLVSLLTVVRLGDTNEGGYIIGKKIERYDGSDQ